MISLNKCSRVNRKLIPSLSQLVGNNVHLLYGGLSFRSRRGKRILYRNGPILYRIAKQFFKRRWAFHGRATPDFEAADSGPPAHYQPGALNVLVNQRRGCSLPRFLATFIPAATKWISHRIATGIAPPWLCLFISIRAPRSNPPFCVTYNLTVGLKISLVTYELRGFVHSWKRLGDMEE